MNLVSTKFGSAEYKDCKEQAYVAKINNILLNI